MTAPKLHIVRPLAEQLTDCVRASPSGRAVAVPAEPEVSALRASIPDAGPSEQFVKRGRNPDLESPTRFVPTVKGPDDVVI